MSTPSKAHSRLRTRRGGAAVLVAAALALTACTGSGAGDTPTAVETPVSTPTETTPTESAAVVTTSLPAQLGVARFLERASFEKHLRGLRLTLRKQRDAYIEAASQLFPPGTRISRPEGGFFLWVELPDGVDALDLHRQAMAQGISLAPGPMFSASGGFGDCLRLNFGHPFTTRVEAALRKVGLLAYASRRPAAKTPRANRPPSQ